MTGRGARAAAAALVLVGVGAWALRPAPPQGWLGVTVDDVEPAGAPAARLGRVFAASPAERAGLRAGDLVRRAGGRRLGSAGDLTSQVRRRAPGTNLPLTLVRDDREITVVATLETRPADVYHLLEADRDPWQEPERVLDLLGLAPGNAVADVGAGGGYFTERLAARVGVDGRVIAVDVAPDALQQLRTRFPRSRFPQVRVQAGTAGDPGLAAGTQDAVLMVDTYHEVEQVDAMLDALRRALRPGGRLVVVDRPAAAWGPGAHAIPEARVTQQALAHGFRVRERHDLTRQFALVLE